MAVEVKNKKQTAGIASATLAITSATAGSILVAFINQKVTTAAPTGKDNISGTTGWTVNETHAIYAASGSSLYVAVKTAVGGETELNPTAGAGGTVTGISYFEVAGCSTTVDTIQHTDNQAAGKTVTSPAVTTTDAGDLVVAAASPQESSGTVEAWTGTGPMTNTETTTTRCIGGSYIPGTTLSAVTFTANWTTSRSSGMLAVALKPSGAEVKEIAGKSKLTFSAKAAAAQSQGIVAQSVLLLNGKLQATQIQAAAAKSILTFTSKAVAQQVAGLSGQSKLVFTAHAAPQQVAEIQATSLLRFIGHAKVTATSGATRRVAIFVFDD